MAVSGNHQDKSSPGPHKKQTGGHGQFGDVWMEFEPSGEMTKQYIFEEQVFGGSVPKNFFPAVEKGLAENINNGVLAGYPVVGLKATLVDGSYHPVDSSEMAFKLATTIAFKDGLAKAKPTLLEPIAHVEVVVPERYMGRRDGRPEQAPRPHHEHGRRQQSTNVSWQKPPWRKE